MSSSPRTRSRVGRRAGSALAGVLAAATIVPLTGTPAHALAQAAGTGDALGVVAQDSFSRSAAGGLGTADVGGSWTVAGAGTEFSVASSVARLRLSKPGAGTGAYLLDTSATDVDLTSSVAIDQLPTGGGTYVYVEGRRVAGAGDYRLKLRYLADRTLVVALLRVQGGTETTLGSTTLAGWTTAAGKQLQVRLRLRGTSPTLFEAKAWAAGTAEPAAWLLKATDAAATLQTAGSPGVVTYLSGSSTGTSQAASIGALTVTRPVVAVEPTASSSTYTATSGAPTFTLRASTPGSSFQCQVDGAAWASCTTPVSFPGLADGAHRVAARAVDSDGFATAAVTREVVVDTHAPVLTVAQGPAEGSTSASRTQAFAVASSESADLSCSVDAGAFAACPDPLTLTGLRDGAHSLAVRGTDAAGNVGASVRRAWSVDATAPVVTVATGTRAVRDRSATVSFSADEAATFGCRLDAGTWDVCTSPLTVTGLTDGSHTLSVRGTDAVGNVGDVAGSTWTVDATAPQTGVSGVPGADQSLSTMIVTPTSSETGSTFECSLDGAAFTACTVPTTFSGLAAGTHVVDVRATDAAGNVDVTPARWSWTVRPADVTAPQTTISGGTAQGVRLTGTATYSFVADEQATFQCRLDDGAWNPCSGSVSWSPSQSGFGVHTVSVRATDAAGNVDPSPATRTWTTVSNTPGQLKPDAWNTGVPAGAVLTDYYGDLTISTPGTVVDGLDVHGFVKINAANVTIKRSKIRGGVAVYTAGNRSLISSTQPGAVIEDVELSPDYPSVRIDGLKGYGFTARRVNIHDTVDTALVFGDNSTITTSWLHDNRHYLVDPNHNNTPSHDDGVQVQGGRNIRITGNRIPDADNAGLMITQDTAITSDLQFTDNWADGGGCTVNVAEKGKGPIQGLVVSSNRFGHATAVADCPVIAPSTTPMTAVGNVYDDTNLPARIRRNG
ncbi:hypothetical protein [Angustibacter aerolatus]